VFQVPSQAKDVLTDGERKTGNAACEFFRRLVGKIRDFKNPRMGCEQALDKRGKMIGRPAWVALVRMAAECVPKLFFAWNARVYHGERPLRGFVHSMKKNIL
jgi:hypothetical protein